MGVEFDLYNIVWVEAMKGLPYAVSLPVPRENTSSSNTSSVKCHGDKLVCSCLSFHNVQHVLWELLVEDTSGRFKSGMPSSHHKNNF